MPLISKIIIAISLIGWTLAAAHSPDRCTLASTVADAKLTLSTRDSQTRFREGEIIPLVLSFTSTQESRYRVTDRSYDRIGRLGIDTYCLEPDTRDPIADYLSMAAGIGGGIGGEQWLSKEPFTATADLNEWKQLGVGHYRLWVVTSRVRAVTLRSNTIEFDVIATDAASRARELQELTATYESSNSEQQKGAARRLRFLNTRQSAATLARLFWSRNDQPGGWELLFGLFGSPYRTDVVAAMNREINNPEHPITQEFLDMLVSLQVGPAAPLPSESDSAGLRAWMESLEAIRTRRTGMMKAALAATVAALPQKRGPAHAITLQTLATDRSELLDKETVSKLQRQL